jgi:type IV secretion system protein VirD4
MSTNDERTAKRVSDALGTATEMKAMKNYAGSRLSPWLGHLMVSRSETARPLLTPGEVMQLPPTDEIVMVSGVHPIRAKKARYYEDARLQERIPPPPVPTRRKRAVPTTGVHDHCRRARQRPRCVRTRMPTMKIPRIQIAVGSPN